MTASIHYMFRWVPVLAFVAALAAGCGTLGGGTVSANAWELIDASPDESQLLVTTSFGGVASGCSRFEGWEVNETAERVEIKALLWKKRFPSDCTDDGANSTASVQLGEALGDRELVGCGADDCRSFESDVRSLFQLASSVMAIDDRVIVADSDGLKLFDSDGTLLHSDPTQQLHELSRAHELVVGNRRSGGVVAYDPAEAITRWTNPNQVRVTDHDSVYVCGGDNEVRTLSQLSSADGIVGWTARSSCEFVVPLEQVVLAIGGDPSTDGGSELLVLDRETGKERERRAIDDGLADHVSGFTGATRVGDYSVVFGWQSHTVVIDENGCELARRDERLGNAVGATAELLLTANGGVVQATRPLTGEVAWSIEVPGLGDPDTTPATTIVDDALWFTEAGAVTHVDIPTGERVWTTQVAFSDVLTLAALDGVVYVQSPLALTALDSVSGGEIWSSPIPWSGDVVDASASAEN